MENFSLIGSERCVNYMQRSQPQSGSEHVSASNKSIDLRHIMSTQRIFREIGSFIKYRTAVRILYFITKMIKLGKCEINFFLRGIFPELYRYFLGTRAVSS